MMKRWLSANASMIRAFLLFLDTPRALTVSLMLREGMWDDLALLWVDPLHYPEGAFSALKFRRDTAATDLLRKAPLPTSINRKDNALKAWEDAETQCFLTNEFLVSLDAIGGGHKDPLARRYANFLHSVKTRMKRWLGDLPDFLEGGFGPGTCVEYEGSDPTVVDKLWLTPTTTPDAADLFRLHYDQTHWGRSRWASRIGSPGLSRGNRLTTVPKDGKTDRPISIEPLGNLWLQLGIGRHLKRRLRNIGLPAYRPDSRELFPGYVTRGVDAQAVHREMLFRCRRQRFSTIDLSSASDTIALELVRRVIPDDWFQLLDCCRSKHTWVPSRESRREGHWRHLEKFSSMGNGFTFELESFVFCGLLTVAFGLMPGRDLWVFGDDIIIPECHFDAACNLLEVFGFSPNRRKSFKSGPFFESCGGNVHSDMEVTPVRIKAPLDCPSQIYAFHNAMARWGAPRRVLRLIRDQIPRRLQFPGPEHLGDVVLHRLPYRTITRACPQQRWVRILVMEPTTEIPLERWSDELAVSALLLGSSTRVRRRGGPVTPVAGYASVS